ncbi:MAG: NAD+ synthase [bacterium]
MILSDEISKWIKIEVEKAGAQGIVVGLSGGIDSAVTATLSKKAVGDNVLGLIMPCFSSSTDEDHARLIAQRLKIKTKRIELDAIYQTITRALEGAGMPEDNKLSLANLKPRLRMMTLYYVANCLNYLVAGTGNKSEIMVGYFTKYGDGGVDILPIGGLLKTEVRELAKELDIPEEILTRVPTAGLWEGQTDEGELGITYENLDKILRALESGEPLNFQPDIVTNVKRLIETSQHKRMLPPIFEK